jgi:outer membrane receptor for ferrienterochelin and colicin
MKPFIGLLLLLCSKPVLSQKIPVHPDPDTLKPYIDTLENVIISSSRTNQLLKNIPLTVQVINREDIEEGMAQSPANIRELLTELSGTQVQQTSAVSGNAAIRLQGLDGRYTQLLKDGFPLYGGFSGSLSILQIPPLDLHQVEVIKGAGSALYGGDAVAGIINLVSRTPDSVLHLDLIANQTQRGGTDLAGYFSRRNRNVAITLMATGSRQQPEDVNKDGFTDLARIRQASLAPSFFWYPSDNTIVRLGLNVSGEDRTGGDLQAVQQGADSLHPFLQSNHTDRDYYQLSIIHKGQQQQTLTFKNAVGYFYRRIGQSTGEPAKGLSTTGFSAAQISSFTEASYGLRAGPHHMVAGISLVTDRFNPNSPHEALGYTHTTAGVFAQDDWKLGQKTTLEAGARADAERTVYFLPRLALLYKPLHNMSARLGGGFAYKLPTVFNAQDEEEGYQQVYPLAPDTKVERAASANLAINYSCPLGDELLFAADENLYYTRLNHALVPQPDSLQRGWYYYINAPGPVVSFGSETNARLTLDDLSFAVSYTYTHTQRQYLAGRPPLPLAPESRLASFLTYEAEPHWKAGVDALLTGGQYLDNGTRTPSFWTYDLMVQTTWGHWSVMLNLENFTDTRQSRFGPLYTGTRQDPVFDQIYAPLEGRIISLAIRYSL